MKVAGIIAEYNPFHNGHAYHIEEVRKKTGADYIIAIMSGNFVQRGGPAIVDKYTRAKMALLAGADLILELPVIAATASAETFARCGVAILNAIGVVTHLGFGCETEDLKLLDQLATLFAGEPSEYQELLSSFVKKGLSYPAARASAAAAYLESIGLGNVNTVEEALNNPNNILAIEYLKAIKQLGSSMKPCPILRQGNGYHDQTATGSYGSATAIRKEILASEYSLIHNFLKQQIPACCADVLSDAIKSVGPVTENDFSGLLHYKLCLEKNDFLDYADVRDELANRILNLQENYTSFSCFIEDLKTKNMTYTSISRGLLHILLDIKKTDMEILSQLNYAPYIRILGFRKASSLLLNELKHSHIPVIAQLAKDQKDLEDLALRVLELDISSAHIYNVIKGTKGSPNNCKNEYRTPLIYI